MNITFLIGNGFDKAAGLRTSYKEFNEHYLALPRNDSIKSFRESLEIDKDRWSYAEEAMGASAGKCTNSQELDKFCEDMQDYKTELAKYLREQEAQTEKHFVKTHANIAQELESFYKDLPKLYSDILSSKLCKSIGNNYNFISFNYTNLLDKYIDNTMQNLWHTDTYSGKKVFDEIKNVVHIHGTVEQNLIMGVNDDSQISTNISLTRRQKRALIKQEANSATRTGNVEIAKSIIFQSDIICIFGMALGKTDQFWWDTIAEWLNSETTNTLVVFARKTDYNTLLPELFAEAYDEKQDEIFKVFGIDNEQEKYESKILISINSGLFQNNIIDLMHKKEQLLTQLNFVSA